MDRVLAAPDPTTAQAETALVFAAGEAWRRLAAWQKRKGEPLPHRAVGCLDIPGETRGVHQRRFPQPIAERARRWPSRGKSLGQISGDLHISVASAAASSADPGSTRGLTRPAHGGLAHQRHDRHAHPERVQAGGVAVVGETCPARRRCGGRVPGTAGAAAGRRTSTRSGAIAFALPAGPARVGGGRLRGPASAVASVGTARSTSAHSCSTAALTLQKLFRQPKVTWPLRPRPAEALTAGSLASGS